MYIVCVLKSSHYDKYINVEEYLFVTVKLTKNPDISKYRYSGYGIWFDWRGAFSYSSDRFDDNAIICGVDMSSSINVDNKTQKIFSKESWWRSYAMIRWCNINCRTMYSINFTATKTRFV